MTISYSFNGVSFSTWCVHVSQSTGLIGKPPLKQCDTFEYPGEAGAIPNLADTAYDVRTIKLDCWIKTTNVRSLITCYNQFTAMFKQTSTKTLSVTIGGTTLTFSVYLHSISELKKSFSDGVNVGTFTLTLVEPDTSSY